MKTRLIWALIALGLFGIVFYRSSTPSSPVLVNAAAPIVDHQPSSMLLPPGTMALNLNLTTSQDTTCAFSVGNALPYGQMIPFDLGSGTKQHETLVHFSTSDPNILHQVYVRCDSQPDFLLSLLYRSRAEVNPPFPRIGNLWGWHDLLPNGLAYMSRIDLWLGAAHARADQISTLRQMNPHMLILTNINAVDSNDALPDDYFLKDIDGNKFEVWPGNYALNLTKLYVAEHQAQMAYERMLAANLMFDGVFFDNVFTTVSWRKFDIYGNEFRADANEDGIEDDPDWLDAAWQAGVFHEMETFRSLMPHALTTGHGMKLHEPGIASLFNGKSLGFRTADVLEDEMIFADLWREYHGWLTEAQQPLITMIESSPPDQIAYGYDYSPWEKIPPTTLNFARDFYPYMRFGLALTLMNDGYFTHEFGDTWHGNDWWYDELDFDLGYPVEPAQRVDVGPISEENLIVNGGFETTIESPWRFLVNESEGNLASLTQDSGETAVGTTSARIEVTAVSGTRTHVQLAQYDRQLIKDTVYDLSFWAKSEEERPLTVSAQKTGGDWRNYGLWHHLLITDTWQQYNVSFVASDTANDARIQFLLGEAVGTLWLDEVSLTVRPPDVYQRAFTNGLVLLNGSDQPQTIDVGSGYRRLLGQQAPLFDMILDDNTSGFSTTGNWQKVVHDSGELKATGPFFHCWQVTCHERIGTAGVAKWELPIEASDIYTITAWWPAAPQADGWNQQVIYEVVVNDHVVATKTLDQRSGGDEWHFVAEVPLSAADTNTVRVSCTGAAPCIADALHLRSHSRYNDGALVEAVTLQPKDGIILASAAESAVYLPVIVNK